MASIVITESELLEALAQCTPGTGPENARTVAELSASQGIGDLRVRRGLKLLQAQGRLQVHRVSRPSLDGRLSIVPAYTITPAKKNGKR